MSNPGFEKHSGMLERKGDQGEVNISDSDSSDEESEIEGNSKILEKEKV